MVSMSCCACSRVMPSASAISKNLPWRTSAMAGIPEAVERRADRLALRVEHGGLQGDEDASFHGNSIISRERRRNVLFTDGNDNSNPLRTHRRLRFRSRRPDRPRALRRAHAASRFRVRGRHRARTLRPQAAARWWPSSPREIVDFLCGLGVDGVVVACNTASAVALPGLAERCPVPVWGVIDPGVEAATRATRSGHVGVIGTEGTIAQRRVPAPLEARGFRVWAQACPMLVHVVEEGLAGFARGGDAGAALPARAARRSTR